MTSTTAREDESGFTLVEALIAIVILVFGLLAVTNLLIVGASSNSTANQSSAATALASEQLETLKAIPFGNLSAGGNLETNTTGFYRDPSSDGRLNVDGVGPFVVRWRITSLANQAMFVQVRAEPLGGFLKTRARADFSTFRTCTAVGAGCPNP
jgi:type II secretory pathway pseudopilin PulG